MDSVNKALIMGDYACEEFGLINRWHVEEKIDGMNVRIIVHKENMVIAGRGDDSVVPNKLRQHITDLMTPERIQSLQVLIGNDQFTLFGEGYGPSIQNGGNYRDDQGFILFDCMSTRWSTREELAQIATLLNCPTPHQFGMMTEEEIVALIQSKPLSLSSVRPHPMEGVICRSNPLMISNYTATPLMFKLKCKDMRS